MKDTKEFTLAQRNYLLSLAAPAHKIIHLCAWFDDEAQTEVAFAVYPVIAMSVRSFDSYGKHKSGEILPPTAKEICDDGWWHVETETTGDLWIVDDDFGMISTNDSLLMESHTVRRDLVLNGGPEDVERIAETKTRMARQLREKVKIDAPKH